jgi:hypothetical protein
MPRFNPETTPHPKGPASASTPAKAHQPSAATPPGQVAPSKTSPDPAHSIASDPESDVAALRQITFWKNGFTVEGINHVFAYDIRDGLSMDEHTKVILVPRMVARANSGEYSMTNVVRRYEKDYTKR